MRTLPDIHLQDYHYDLPKERIAQYPLQERDQSKLLVMKGDQISEHTFRTLPTHLPPGAMLLFNDTRVIRARMLFRKATGATIEIFFLNPLTPSTDHAVAFGASSPVRWECVIGNAKRWKEGFLTMHFSHEGDDVELYAALIKKGDEHSVVELSWTPPHFALASIFEAVGHIPLPPYIHRADEPGDAERYQTVYANHNGSVAAPTAGLHFTPSMLEDFMHRGFLQEHITLHVGAGTFRPVSAGSIADHLMHHEEIIVTARLLEALANHRGALFPVGTTSVRSIESVYWYGLRALLNNESLEANFIVRQWEPYEYQNSELIPARKVFGHLYRLMKQSKLERLHGTTSLIIVPGYPFAVTNGLITNFHQPGSTLLLLVSAWVGERWQEAYRFALDHDFRFLSYGDACLFL